VVAVPARGGAQLVQDQAPLRLAGPPVAGRDRLRDCLPLSQRQSHPRGLPTDPCTGPAGALTTRAFLRESTNDPSRALLVSQRARLTQRTGMATFGHASKALGCKRAMGALVHDHERDDRRSLVDESLWLRLHQRRYRLVSLARRWGMTAEDAEDAASETIVRAATYGQLDVGRMDQFLTTALRRIFVDSLRQAASAQRAFRKVSASFRELQEPFQEPIESMTTSWILDRINLSGAERAILTLFMKGHSHAEIGMQLGLSTHASELGLARARRKARSTLGTVTGDLKPQLLSSSSPSVGGGLFLTADSVLHGLPRARVGDEVSRGSPTSRTRLSPRTDR